MIPILLGWDPLVVGIIVAMVVDLATLTCCFLKENNFFAEKVKKSQKRTLLFKS